jgi:hypothetical protein
LWDFYAPQEELKRTLCKIAELKNASPELRISSSASIYGHRKRASSTSSLSTPSWRHQQRRDHHGKVPRADELVVEAKVAPSDIDQVATVELLIEPVARNAVLSK